MATIRSKNLNRKEGFISGLVKDMYFKLLKIVGAKERQLVENSGKIYAVDVDGQMITEPVKLTPDQDGALQYPGLVK